MNNLKIFQPDNQSIVLDKRIEPKSGVHYFTNNQQDYKNKQQVLLYQKIPFTTNENDGIFSIEW